MIVHRNQWWFDRLCIPTQPYVHSGLGHEYLLQKQMWFCPFASECITFGGTLSLTQSINHVLCCYNSLLRWLTWYFVCLIGDVVEKAFFDPSLLELLYFPEDQKWVEMISLEISPPRLGPGHPSSPLVHLLPNLFSLFTFPFLSLALPIFFFCPSLPFLPE